MDCTCLIKIVTCYFTYEQHCRPDYLKQKKRKSRGAFILSRTDASNSRIMI